MNPELISSPEYIKYSQRFGVLSSLTIRSDFFSSDGSTWNPEADWVQASEYTKYANKYEETIYGEIAAIMSGPRLKSEDEFSGQLQEFLTRVESRSNR